MAHGNDTGGSIRVPASMCGVVGIKPTRASISLGPDFGEFRGFLTCEGVLTRSVRDAAAVLRQISGGATGDPYPPPAWRPRPAAQQAPPRLRVGVVTQPPGGREPVHPACAAAADRVASALDRLGHRVTTAHVPAFAEAAYEQHLQTLVAVGCFATWTLVRAPGSPDRAGRRRTVDMGVREQGQVGVGCPLRIVG